MVEKNVKVVIGANFGDEGKGLMTDYFCHQSALRGENCIVVCHNGGAQRGHTVDAPDGLHHVFHHFGSGTFAGADTYLSKDFILNPILFRREWEELKKLGYEPKAYLNPLCRVTTPFDMIINQVLEEKRSNDRHGSCGMGIFETIKRYEENYGYPAWVLLENYDNQNKEAIKAIKHTYLPKRFNELKIQPSEEWEEIINADGLIEQFLSDLEFTASHVTVCGDTNALEKYQNIIFEGGQGLLLDQNNKEYFPHLTPSNTGLKNPAEMILRLFPDSNVEVCYVTRPYLTRHGAGRIDNECRKEEINPDMEDLTNVPNQHQGTMRYGKMNVSELLNRIQKDFSNGKGWKISLSITHSNEVPGIFESVDSFEVKDLKRQFDVIYHSFGKARNDIKQAD